MASSDVKIVVSGGFTAERIRAFEAADVPVDAYGVGSSLIRGANDFTADVVMVNGRPCAKVGREYKPNPRLTRGVSRSPAADQRHEAHPLELGALDPVARSRRRRTSRCSPSSHRRHQPAAGARAAPRARAGCPRRPPRRR